MDFQLSEEQLQLKKMVRDFAEREIAPHVMKWDEPGTFPLETIRARQTGLLGTIFPQEYGGAGMGFIEYVDRRRRARGWTVRLASRVAAHTSLCSNHIYIAGDGSRNGGTFRNLPPANSWAHGD